MRKGSIGLILATSVLLLGVWTGISIGAPPQADAWQEYAGDMEIPPPRASVVIGEIVVKRPQIVVKTDQMDREYEDHWVIAKVKIHWTCPALTPDTVRQWPDGERNLRLMMLDVYWMGDCLQGTRTRLVGEWSAVTKPGDPSKSGIWEYDLEINGNFLLRAEVGVHRLTLKMEGTQGISDPSSAFPWHPEYVFKDEASFIVEIVPSVTSAPATPKKLEISILTDKRSYTPGSLVIIEGSVWEREDGLPQSGASVKLEVGGITASDTTDSEGHYRIEFILPSDVRPGAPPTRQ